MYLIRLPLDQSVQWLFVHADPQTEGCSHPIQDGVEYEDDATTVTSAEQTIDGVTLARSTSAPTRYKRFLCREDALDAGYEPLNGASLQLSSWSRYLASKPIRPVAAPIETQGAVAT